MDKELDEQQKLLVFGYLDSTLWVDNGIIRLKDGHEKYIRKIKDFALRPPFSVQAVERTIKEKYRNYEPKIQAEILKIIF
jgi:hypothetical protein